ncbi:MAG: aldose epimerase [Nitriliruptorales bacterium]|nr:aldose epimerase [Nitriliruptorales bacterium]
MSKGAQAVAPTGQQHDIHRNGQRAAVTEVGAALRSYDVNDMPVLDGFGIGDMATAARGCPLIPWPNRLHEGRYTWDDEEQQTPLDEPDKGNALHGFTRFMNWRAADHTGDAVTMRLRLHAQQGYPFVLDLFAHYALDDEGLTVTTTARNVGGTPAPYAMGAHPYLTVGTDRIDEAVLHLPAATYLPTDQSQIPTGREPVEDTPYDFRTPRRIGAVEMDHAFTDLERDDSGRAWLELAHPDAGRAVTLWADEHFPYLEVFTGDTLPERQRRRGGLGVEPMTCPPNAFQTGEDVLRLEPGDEFACRWGILPTPR